MTDEERGLEIYEYFDQRDFLSMKRREWQEFVDTIERVVLHPSPDWTRAEVFLAERGLYVFLDLEYLKYAAPDLFRKKKLYEVAIDILERVADMEVVAALQPTTVGQGGVGYAWPPERDRELMGLLERCEWFEEIAIAMMRRYGPCVLVDADDHADYALLAARPKARRRP
jgi:hypothetical protein